MEAGPCAAGRRAGTPGGSPVFGALLGVAAGMLALLVARVPGTLGARCLQVLALVLWLSAPGWVWRAAAGLESRLRTMTWASGWATERAGEWGEPGCTCAAGYSGRLGSVQLSTGAGQAAGAPVSANAPSNGTDSTSAIVLGGPEEGFSIYESLAEGSGFAASGSRAADGIAGSLGFLIVGDDGPLSRLVLGKDERFSQHGTGPQDELEGPPGPLAVARVAEIRPNACVGAHFSVTGKWSSPPTVAAAAHCSYTA